MSQHALRVADHPVVQHPGQLDPCDEPGRSRPPDDPWQAAKPQLRFICVQPRQQAKYETVGAERVADEEGVGEAGWQHGSLVESEASLELIDGDPGPDGERLIQPRRLRRGAPLPSEGRPSSRTTRPRARGRHAWPWNPARADCVGADPQTAGDSGTSGARSPCERRRGAGRQGHRVSRACPSHPSGVRTAIPSCDRART